MEKNLIYALYCPMHNVPVYVGKSSVGIDRPFVHIKEKSHSVKVNEWVRDLRNAGHEPIVVVLEHGFIDEYAIDKEKFWIEKYLKEGHLLLNQTNVSSAYYQAKEFDVVNTDFLFNVRMYIKGRRKLLKLTQKELAERAGVGLRFLRELEQGSKNNFSTLHIQKVLYVIGNVKLVVVNVS